MKKTLDGERFRAAYQAKSRSWRSMSEFLRALAANLPPEVSTPSESSIRKSWMKGKGPRRNANAYIKAAAKTLGVPISAIVS